MILDAFSAYDQKNCFLLLNRSIAVRHEHSNGRVEEELELRLTMIDCGAACSCTRQRTKLSSGFKKAHYGLPTQDFVTGEIIALVGLGRYITLIKEIYIHVHTASLNSNEVNVESSTISAASLAYILAQCMWESVQIMLRPTLGRCRYYSSKLLKLQLVQSLRTWYHQNTSFIEPFTERPAIQ